MHFYAPGGLSTVSKNIVFVLDVSGSMDGTKAHQVARAMTAILNQLHHGDFFNVICFADYVKKWKDGLVKVNHRSIRDANAWIQEVEIVGCMWIILYKSHDCTLLNLFTGCI